MRHRLILTATPLVLAAVVLAGCGAVADTGGSPTTATDTTVDTTQTSVYDGELSAQAVLAANSDVTVVNDDEWSADDAVDIALTGGSADTTADGVTVDDSTVTITAAGVYRLSGTLAGSVVVSAPDDALVVLILDDVEIVNDDGAAIAALTADDVALHLAAGSENTVTDAASYADDADVNAAIYSDPDLTISGTGSLVVNARGNDGITSKDDLVILSGDITVIAADDALRGKDALVVAGGTLDLTAGGDALTSDKDDDPEKGYVWISGGSIVADAGDDGVAAATDVVITGGDIDIVAGGGAGATVSGDSSPKGIVGDVVAVIEGGTIVVDAADDGLHSNGSIGIGGGEITLAAGDDGVHADAVVEIRDGSLTVTGSYEALEGADITISGGVIDLTASDDGVNASGGTSTGSGMGGGMQDTGETLTITGGSIRIDAGGDGLDSNGSIEISGGETVVFGPTNAGNGALDANGEIVVTGGTLLAVGASGMAETPGGSSTQAWISATASVAAGQTVGIVDASGRTIATFVSPKALGSIVYSSPELASGASYDIVVDGTTAATVTEGTAAGFGGQGAPNGGRP